MEWSEEVPSKLEDVIWLMDEDSLEEVCQECPEFRVQLHVGVVRYHQFVLQKYNM